MTDKKVFKPYVLVKIYRPEWYEDVCDELVVDDFVGSQGSGFKYEVVEGNSRRKK